MTSVQSKDNRRIWHIREGWRVYDESGGLAGLVRRLCKSGVKSLTGDKSKENLGFQKLDLIQKL